MMLVFMTMCWGLSYVFMDICMTEMGPLTVNAYRFTIAFVVACILCYRYMVRVSIETVKYAVIIGAISALSYGFITLGVRYTSLSNAGFLGGLGVVFVPIIGSILKKSLPERRFIVVVVMALIGIGLLTLNENLEFAVGDIYCIMAALCYSFQLLTIESAVRKRGVNAFQMGILMLGVTAVIFLIGAQMFEHPVLPQAPKVWSALLFLGIVCTGLGIIANVVAQKYTTANHAGVIFTLEPVFAACAAFFIAGEVLPARGYLGAAILMGGVIFMEYPNFVNKDK